MRCEPLHEIRNLRGIGTSRDPRTQPVPRSRIESLSGGSAMEDRKTGCLGLPMRIGYRGQLVQTERKYTLSVQRQSAIRINPGRRGMQCARCRRCGQRNESPARKTIEHEVNCMRSVAAQKKARQRMTPLPEHRLADEVVARNEGGNYILGITTASITWITPLEQAMSVFTTFALSILTLPPLTTSDASEPWTVLAFMVLTSFAMTLPATT